MRMGQYSGKKRFCRRDINTTLRWFWLWVAVVIFTVVGTWHYKGGVDRVYEPLLMLALVASSAVAAYVTIRFTRRLNRLRQAVEKINLRDLAVHVPMEGTDAVAALAQSFNRMVDRLASQERVRRQFFADLTHEIRHPIAILMGRLESIQDGVLPLDNEQILLLHDMVIGLKRLVTDMNDLSLADVGQLSLHLAPVNVWGIIEQLQLNMEPVAEDLGITLSSQVVMDMPRVYADGDRLRLVLTNLLTNALHYTSHGGYVKLTAQYDDNYAIFQVSDNGSGIDPSDVRHLFERFYRADKSRSRAKGGSGLGLSIVRSLVELHGGAVHVESSIGKGSQFTVRLPLGGPPN